MKKTKKIVSLSLGTILLSSSLVGCSTNIVEKYLQESQKMSTLENYDFVHNINFSTKLKEQNVNIDFSLEGEIVKDNWFYTKVMYKDKQLTEIMLKDEKLFLNIGSMVKNLTPDETISLEVIQGLSIIHTMLFDAQDYLEVNLKDYGLSTKDLFSMYNTDENSFYSKLIELSMTETSNLLQKYSKEVLNKEKNVYTLTLNNTHFDELSKNMLTNIDTNKDTYTNLLLTDIKTMVDNAKNPENTSIYSKLFGNYEYNEEELKELSTTQIDSFIESLKTVDYGNININQEFTIEKGKYLISNFIEDDTLSIKIDSIITEKKDKNIFTYGTSLPNTTITIEKLIENLSKIFGEMNFSIDSTGLNLSSENVEDNLIYVEEFEETKDIVIGENMKNYVNLLKNKNYDVEVDNQYIFADLTIDNENYLEKQICIIFEQDRLVGFNMTIDILQSATPEEKEKMLNILKTETKEIANIDTDIKKMIESEQSEDGYINVDLSKYEELTYAYFNSNVMGYNTFSVDYFNYR